MEWEKVVGSWRSESERRIREKEREGGQKKYKWMIFLKLKIKNLH